MPVQRTRKVYYITSQHQEDNANPRTYAEAAKGEGNNSHTILLYPAVPYPNDSTAGNRNPETKSMRELLSSKLNSTTEKIKIKSYRRIKNKGLAVDCENDEEIQKLIDKIQKSDELKEKIVHKEPKKRRPRCIIYNIPKDTTEQEVIDTIELATECDRNSIEFPLKLKGRKEGYQHWVVDLPTPAFFTLEAAGKLVMNWSIYRIKEFFSVRRCFSCQSFGHLQRNCKSKRKFCAYCSKNHDTRDCTSSYPVCINCDESNDKDGTDHDIRHSAADHNCPSYKKEIFFYQKSVNY
ncbi:hypothetical protein AVEN_145100-1 [Araneus ventricosus]|uniref:CCHC-type domain-containing protein n=1 Tax=Araneus ventricosus TaxID=182803 RepID=A0A4Y2VQ84_ARAVE|nr:hypothetical protein AVEN_145100-1 [Araneus ventricosus]